ncbi:MAG: hypothetical protein WCA30_03175 [Dermatophilaceae bacterium]
MRTTNSTHAVGTATAHTPLGAAVGAQQWTALASVVAGAIHLVVAPHHREEWWVFGAFFVVIGAFQLAFAPVVLRRPSRSVTMTGIAVNLGVVLIWVVSRTTGLPISPPEDITSHEGVHLIEGVGVADLAATGAELGVVCLLVTMLPPHARRLTANLLLATGVCLWALRLSGAMT